MPFNFPDSPTLNQVYAYNGQAWKWNGEAWDKNKGETVSVKDFGSVGDGVADESTAIQNAISAVAVSGGCVFFPAGTYIVNAQITAASNVCLCGESRESTTLRLKNSTNQNMLFAGSATTGFTVCDLTLDGNKANNTAGAAIDLTAATRPVVRNCRVINTAGNGVVFQSGSVDGQILGTVFDGCGGSSGHSVSLSASDRFLVSNNVIRNSANSGVNLGVCSRCVITGNTIENDSNNTSGFGGVRIASDNSTGLSYLNVVTGNQIRRFPRGVFLIGAQYTTVSGNAIENINYEGILTGPNASTSSYVNGYNTFTGNVIANTGQAATAGSTAGISLTGADYNVVVGNSINDVTAQMEQGILLAANAYGNSLYNEVRSNLILGFTTAAVSAPAANLDRVVLGPNMQAAINTAIASAATIALPPTSDYFNITGTTGISTINGGWIGRLVSLQFSGALTVTDGGGGGSLNLAGNFNTAAGSVLTLRHTGSQWVEVARSNN